MKLSLHIPTSVGRKTAAAMMAAVALLASACGGSDTSDSSSAGASSTIIDSERCQANRDAGKITYLSSFDLGGAMTGLAPVAAAELGYFEDLCLDVDVKPKTDNNAQILSAGKAQVASFGSAGDLLTAIANGAKITGVSTYGAVPLSVLMTRNDGSVNSLKDLEGKTVGFKATISPQISAMLESAGVDVDKVKFVSVGFDPMILPGGQVDALTGFRDNEPNLLATKGEAPKVFNPEDFGIAGTFGVQAVNTEWGQQHPEAVEDFLRASLHAIAWLQENDANLNQALEWSKDRSPAGYDAAQQKYRWTTNVGYANAGIVEGRGLGYQTPEMWQPEADLIDTYDLVKAPVDPKDAQTDEYINAIYEGSNLIWPPVKAGQ